MRKNKKIQEIPLIFTNFDTALREKTQLSFSQILPEGQINASKDDILLDKIKFKSNKPKKDKKFFLNNGLLTVPKGVTSFDAKIKIIDDTLVEGTEKLTLSVANHQATASITDNDFNDVEIASFQAANSNGAEKTKGYNQFLSYSIRFTEN